MTSEIHRTQFYSGGFFLIRAAYPEMQEQDAKLLPEKIISLSPCFCERLDSWQWEHGSASRFNIQNRARKN